MIIDCPKHFNYDECLVYMKRSPLESTHSFVGKVYRKVLKIHEKLLLVQVTYKQDQLHIECLNRSVTWSEEEAIKDKIAFIFDLNFDLQSLYDAHVDDEITFLYEKFKGLRLIHMDNFFEGLIWAVLGQQINLKFAYTLKKRLVENYGQWILYQNEKYYYFPQAKVLKNLSVESLRAFQITSRKSEYILGISRLFDEGYFDVNHNLLYDRLMSVRGIGDWTANYVMMKCFQIYDTLPASDAGLMNALKMSYGLEEKPKKEWIISLFDKWNYKAYITFYLWRSLYV